MSNTLGTRFRFTDFGESHGPAIGGVVDGMPAGIEIDRKLIDDMLARRRTGLTPSASSRREPDCVEFLSGIFRGVTLGTPIAFVIANTDARSADYADMEHTYRPNHADYTYDARYGIRDYRGGGRASARETAARVVAGALAMHVLRTQGISVEAVAESIGGISDSIDAMDAALEDARGEGDTLGGVVRCTVKGVPAGIGNPVFGKLQVLLAAAMMSINAAKGFEYGDGFGAARSRGSQQLDTPYFDEQEGRIRMRSNHSGGIQGGISNGEDIVFRVAFKPIATMMRTVDTVTDGGDPVKLTMKGRHDVCVLPRAIVVVEAMAAIAIADALLSSE